MHHTLRECGGYAPIALTCRPRVRDIRATEQSIDQRVQLIPQLRRRPMPTYSADTLDGFVSLIDEAGGLASALAHPHLGAFSYAPTTFVDVALDPFSETYVGQQIALYREISGRELDQTANELTDFPLDHHVAAANSYAIRAPAHMVSHYRRLAESIRRSDLPVAPRVLDMGAGWGMSSEFFALLGAEVVGVDINPHFVELVRRRAERLSLPITVLQGGFDDVEPPGDFDHVFFYESLHHAVKPWEVIARCARMLKPEGSFAIAGEPVQDTWWPSWGMRLDAGSVYCIRKFGWFESGWSRDFTVAMFRRSGLFLTCWDNPDPVIGFVGVARFQSEVILSDPSARAYVGEGWIIEPTILAGVGRMTLLPPSVPDGGSVALRMINNRPTPIAVTIRELGETGSMTFSLQPGSSDFQLPDGLPGRTVEIEAETWVPSEETSSSDARTISFHLDRMILSGRG